MEIQQHNGPDSDVIDPVIDLGVVERIVERLGGGQRQVIPILQAIQQEFRYLPREALRHVCRITEITPSTLSGVSTFYDQFRHRPVGRHIISVCHGTACHVKKAQTVSDLLHRELKIQEGDDTDSERLFTVEKVACLGCCTLAPVMMIDGVTYGHLTSPEIIRRSLRDFQEMERQGGARNVFGSSSLPGKASKGEIRICTDSCCRAGGTGEVYDALMRAVHALQAPAEVKRVSCVLMCNQVPFVEVCKPGEKPALYARVIAADAAEIVRRHFPSPNLAKRLKAAFSRGIDQVLTDTAWEPVTRYAVASHDKPLSEFYGPQKHIALEHYGRHEPLDLDAYVENGGFAALQRCLTEHDPAQIIRTIEASKLRGRGGGGFPTGVKWDLVAKSDADPKYLVCNGDEGDPGAFMDRMLLETFPYRVLEGMLIAARAVGAREGYLYIRAEYPLALKVIREALDRCRQHNYIGDNICGSGFSFHLHVLEGAGAFVCGEETALIASIEGRRAMPRLRPPYPAKEGLWGKPTLVNNTETFAMVPWILRNGAEAFTAIGTAESRGTKVFALAGKIHRGGLIEVPMGTTIREVVESIGGGIPDGRRFKGVQIGGPSGGCLPARLADTPIDYVDLQQYGAIMGSGGLVVLDDRDCMVDMARYFLEFTQNQSCGKCTFCRVGTKRLLEIMNRLCQGAGHAADIAAMEALSLAVCQSSICGLGRTAPNPVLTTLRYFRDEYEAHVVGRCPAGKCVRLIKYVVTDACIGCTRCAQICPADAIAMRPYEKHEIDITRCTRCDACRAACPVSAIEVV